MKWEDKKLHLIDQRRLPHEKNWFECLKKEDVCFAIKQMVIRGAPAIGCAAAFGLVLDAYQSTKKKWSEYKKDFYQAADMLSSTRPTAVNLFASMKRMIDLSKSFIDDMPHLQVCLALEAQAQKIFDEDIASCACIASLGADYLAERFEKKPLRVLTHCNTGALATAGVGTALGVIKALHQKALIEKVYADETRPWFQGLRLTAFELLQEGICFEVLADHAAAVLMEKGCIDLVIVGADRIAKNADTANKIGTYCLAVLASYHKVPFYVAAPLSTFDPHLETGSQMVIENRPEKEVTHFGDVAIAPYGTKAFNPSFDVTPAHLIAGFFTEKGFFPGK